MTKAAYAPMATSSTTPITATMRSTRRCNAVGGSASASTAAATGAAAAAAASLGHIIRVGHGEAAAHQPVNVVHLGAFDVLGAHRIDQDAHAVELGDTVVLAWLVVQGHAIGRAGAAHAAHE